MSEAKWYNQSGDLGDVIVSTRVRLARNIVGYPFSGLLTASGLWEITQATLNALKKCEDQLDFKLRYLPMETQSENQRASLVERHLISPQFARGDGALLLSQDDKVSMMVGEEDHLRLQVLGAGLCIDFAYQQVDKLETLLGQQIPFAFDRKLGFLTQCPTNLGCGLRISVMAHLPALEQTGALQNIIASAHQLGIVVRGMYGEGSGAQGSFYQISNERSLGLSEVQILQNIGQMADKIYRAEKRARAHFLHDPQRFEDRAWQALGTLKYARLLSYQQLLDLCSTLRLGISLQVVDQVDLATIASLISQTGAGSICANAGANLSPRERDYQRAAQVRAILSQTLS